MLLHDVNAIPTANVPLTAAALKQEAAPRSGDSVVRGQNKDKPNDITIKQALTAIGGAAIGAGIETVGNTASSIVNLPKAVHQAYKTVWTTELIGPVLKTALSALLPVGALAAPILTALVSCGIGIFHGAAEGMENGLGAAVKATAEDVKTFHTELSPKLVEKMQEIAMRELPEGQQPYDIKITEAGKGIVGAAAGAVIDGTGVGAITLLRTPQGVLKMYKEIFKDQGPVLAILESVLVLPAAVLATPIATVAGAVYGVYKGFADAYQDGLSKSVRERFHDVSTYGEWVRNAVV